jgi:hypothetical protein
MSLELTDDDLAEIQAAVAWQLSASRIEYQRLRAAIAQQLPGVTSDAIATTQKALLSGQYRDGGQAADHATFCCALYLLVGACADHCATLIKEGRASAEVIRNLIVMVPQALGALGALAMMLNGSPLAQSFIDQQIGQLRSASAAHAADSRHGQPGGYREKHEKLRSAWASGNYASRDECAHAECPALGLSFSSGRKALRGTPKPTRT